MSTSDRSVCLCCGNARDAAVRSALNAHAYVCADCIRAHVPPAMLDAEVLPFPKTLTEPVREVLSLMLWSTTPIAHALRAAGRGGSHLLRRPGRGLHLPGRDRRGAAVAHGRL